MIGVGMARRRAVHRARIDEPLQVGEGTGPASTSSVVVAERTRSPLPAPPGPGQLPSQPRTNSLRPDSPVGASGGWAIGPD